MVDDSSPADIHAGKIGATHFSDLRPPPTGNHDTNPTRQRGAFQVDSAGARIDKS
jgi:hypothetical protein